MRPRPGTAIAWALVDKEGYILADPTSRASCIWETKEAASKARCKDPIHKEIVEPVQIIVIPRAKKRKRKL